MRHMFLVRDKSGLTNSQQKIIAVLKKLPLKDRWKKKIKGTKKPRKQMIIPVTLPIEVDESCEYSRIPREVKARPRIKLSSKGETALAVRAVGQQKNIAAEVDLPNYGVKNNDKAMRNQGELCYASYGQETLTKGPAITTSKTSSEIEEKVSDILSPERKDLGRFVKTSVDNVAFHDFSEHRYVLEPILQTYSQGQIEDNGVVQEIEDTGTPAVELLELLSRLRNSLRQAILENSTVETQEIELSVYPVAENAVAIASEICDYLENNRTLLSSIAEKLWRIQGFSQLAFEEMMSSLASDLFDSRLDLVCAYDAYYVDINKCLKKVDLGQLMSGLQKSCLKSVNDSDAFYDLVIRQWELYNAALPQSTSKFDSESNEETNENLEYPFEIFKVGEFNMGVRLIYRQEWRPLGDQRGEIVKTIPLGPKQIEKMSVKIVKRLKKVKSFENSHSSEVSTETSDTTKDSSEIVEEAKDNFGWNVDAEASANWGWGKARLAAGVKGNYEDALKETTSSLSEKMQRTASKIKTDSKVTVSTESEQTYESQTSSEIQNPNDEIAVTYIYSKLQKQYEVFTGLAEICNVMMVPESVPLPNDIDEAWIRRYSWIIAKVLLDDSYRDTLALINSDAQIEDAIDFVGTNKMTLESMSGALGELAKNGNNLTLSNIDFVQESQSNYVQSAKEKFEQQRQSCIAEKKKQRLIAHLQDNILHYCRAIWSQEDQQQRMLRYRKQDIRVPLQWQFQKLDGSAIPLQEVANEDIVKGAFVPIDGCETVNLADLIIPAGPIGFHGNYAIYYMRPEFADEDISLILNILKIPYIDPETNDLKDPYLRELEQTYSAPILESQSLPKSQEIKEIIQYVPEIRLKYIIEREESQLNDSDFYEYFVKENHKKDSSIFCDNYAYYRFRKEQSRRLILDTNNLVVDIIPGTGSTLEGFKLMHRGLDVLKVNEEVNQMKLENLRRSKRLEANNYSDPDIENVTVNATMDTDGDGASDGPTAP